MDISFIGTKMKLLFLTVMGVGGKGLVDMGGAAGVVSVARGQGW